MSLLSGLTESPSTNVCQIPSNSADIQNFRSKWQIVWLGLKFRSHGKVWSLHMTSAMKCKHNDKYYACFNINEIYHSCFVISTHIYHEKQKRKCLNTMTKTGKTTGTKYVWRRKFRDGWETRLTGATIFWGYICRKYGIATFWGESVVRGKIVSSASGVLLMSPPTI